MRTVFLFLGFALPGLSFDDFPSTAAKLSSAENMAVMKAICPGKTYIQGDRIMCDACPAELPSLWVPWWLGSVNLGHFVSPTAENALVEMVGCGTSTMNAEATALLARHGNQWTVVNQWQEKMAQECHQLKARAGHDVLVCERIYAWMGVIKTSIFALDFGAEGSGEPKELAVTEDNSGMGCLVGELDRASIDSVVFSKARADGSTDIAITITEGHGKLTEAEQEKCKDAPPEPPLSTRQIHYRYDGKEFKTAKE
jgi:hypothetical protein